jgi:hypothetical protein
VSRVCDGLKQLIERTKPKLEKLSFKRKGGGNGQTPIKESLRRKENTPQRKLKRRAEKERITNRRERGPRREKEAPSHTNEHIIS